ncbi:PorP/SprF family type IX secretion system membrane protein [Aquimarina sp. ERC-38]|uniref:PorP/SprF family type IX secretion system membrane protein n=1 Tax=Aquimarina sp. ERC-38 TaxID=2949996 RepID=UPI0022476BD0|nr:PorP/SprF family type IX secretion system membrane protein [Aquimarina sp. ERC-38]UZO80435.1 PorP/SprF family type IX secretion system membrane protein [Aquimarina sp. ERC-38]
MRHLLQKLVIIGFLSFVQALSGQQLPSFDQYYYNNVLINPAYAGFPEFIEIITSTTQTFTGFEGNPRTINLTGNAPVFDRQGGISAGYTRDEVGVTSATKFFASYAYRIDLDNNYDNIQWWHYNPTFISFGLQTSLLFLENNLLSLGVEGDPVFQDIIDVTIPTANIGILLNEKEFFVGLSVIQLFPNIFFSEKNIKLQSSYQLHGGYYWVITGNSPLVIKPHTLLKYVPNAPAQLDINLAAKFKNGLEIGTGYRSDDTLNFVAGFYFYKRWRAMYTLNQSFNNNPISGRHGLVLSYQFGNGY